ncbi:alpha/beta hydrolase [Crassaminicella profunda]|uniref:alpha/beta hydrolase n=1 Tax=Crassaminicella profunda TaxID=1286698 RepID=UPI001CA799CF|nr:alpha/beta fold hydrolase [Crassaminicella profunda]
MKGCLLIHGFTGAPFEVEPIAKYLEERGYVTLCPTLPGHGKKQRDLKNYSYKDWIQSSEEAYVKLSKKCDSIIIIGFSMGGLLSFHLIQKYKVNCFISIGTPIYCFDFKNLYLDIIDQFQMKNYHRISNYIKSCFTPIYANLNFKKLLCKTKYIIPKINAPTLIIHGKKDPIVKYKSASYIYTHIKSKDKEIRFYKEAKHRIHDENIYQNIYKDIYLFIQKYS